VVVALHRLVLPALLPVFDRVALEEQELQAWLSVAQKGLAIPETP
jgi:hypothetical protein